MSTKQTELVLLTEDEQKQVKVILSQHANLAQALDEYNVNYGAALDSLRKVCGELRRAQLVGKDVSLVLRNSGWTESRASEIKAIVQSPDKVFNDYMARVTGFRLALSAARSALPPPVDAQAMPSKFVNGLRGYLESYFIPGVKFPKRTGGYQFTVPGFKVTVRVSKQQQTKQQQVKHAA
jgi:hypothetical protein